MWISVVTAVPWIRWLVPGLSPRRPGDDPRAVNVRFVADKDVLFHQRSILIFIYTLLLPEGQAVEEWEPAKKAMFIRKSESFGQKVHSLLLVLKMFRIILQTLSNVKRIYTLEIQIDNNKTILWRLVKKFGAAKITNLNELKLSLSLFQYDRSKTCQRPLCISPQGLSNCEMACVLYSTHAISRHAATSPHNIRRRNFTECFNRSVTLARLCTSSLWMVEDRNK